MPTQLLSTPLPQRDRRRRKTKKLVGQAKNREMTYNYLHTENRLRNNSFSLLLIKLDLDVEKQRQNQNHLPPPAFFQAQFQSFTLDPQVPTECRRGMAEGSLALLVGLAVMGPLLPPCSSPLPTPCIGRRCTAVWAGSVSQLKPGSQLEDINVAALTSTKLCWEGFAEAWLLW